MLLPSREVGDVEVLEIPPDLLLSPYAGRLQEGIKSLLARGRKKVLLDLAQVAYLDSPGLGHLMAAVASVGAAGGALKLVRVSPRVSRLLKVTRLAVIFEIFEDEQTAVASFSTT